MMIRRTIEPLTRRHLLQAAGAAAAAGVLPAAACAASATQPAGKPRLCLFSKAFQNRPVDALPDMLGDLGIDAIDLTVRPGGHVLPERVADDLPRAFERFRSAGIAMPMITTGITDADEDHAEAILTTVAKLGIRYVKIGYYRYSDLDKIQATLADAGPRLRDVAALCKRHGLTAGYHNHSGNFLGAALWDIWGLIRDLDPAAIGSYFDVGHATAEGAYAGWRIGLNLMISRIVILALKDMRFDRDPKRGWVPHWGPLGEGMARFDEALKRLKVHGFAGPVSLHVEYGAYTSPVGSDDDRQNIEYVRRDWAFARRLMEKAKLL